MANIQQIQGPVADEGQFKYINYDSGNRTKPNGLSASNDSNALPLKIDHTRRGRKQFSCDACRHRKTMCNRALPCSRCSLAFLDCTYSKTAKRRNRSITQNHKISSEKIPLQMPATCFQLDSRSATTEAAYERRDQNAAIESNRVDQSEYQHEGTDDVEIVDWSSAYRFIEQEKMEFQGHSADRAVIQGMRGRFGDWHDAATHRPLPLSNQVFSFFSAKRTSANEVSLPTRQEAEKLVDAAFNAHLLLYVIHRPTFDFSFSLIYSIDPSEYSSREERFLPLLYSVFAYGTLFVTSEDGDVSYEEIISKASQYYEKSRDLVDIEHCTDLVSLQAVVFMNFFLLSTTRTATCYTYLSTSLSVALRMGLHLSPDETQDMISREVGKRVFWTLRLLLNRISASVGLPKLLNDDHIDTDPPREINDRYLLSDRLLSQPAHEICFISGANAYQRLHVILDRVITLIYSPKRAKGSRISVSLEKIQSIENDLQQWCKDIPRGFQLGEDAEGQELVEAQYLLVTTYAYIRLSLYRPLLRHVLEIPGHERIGNSAAFTYAAACIQSSQNIVMLCEDMWRRGHLHSIDWRFAPLLISGVVTILYAIVMTKGIYESESLFNHWGVGWRLLNFVAKSSFHGRRCRTLVQVMISTLPAALKKVQGRLLSYDVKELSIPPDEMRHSSQAKAQTAALGSQTFSSFSTLDPVNPGRLFPMESGVTKQNSPVCVGSGLQHGFISSDQTVAKPGSHMSNFRCPSPEMAAFSNTTEPWLAGELATAIPQTVDNYFPTTMAIDNEMPFWNNVCIKQGVEFPDGIYSNEDTGAQSTENSVGEGTTVDLLELAGLYMGDMDVFL